ncbi:MAG: thiolase family protein [Ignavibacteria bacterium]|jgi:acetyl-CoA C-acetyltransferase|nr:thiolase family protein [Ignavibacteria bacterium]MDH7528170.1 thiolase family protein [Ignavibacteria bacterium]
MKEVFICDALRTPIGSFLGTLSSIPAPKLAAELIKKVVERNGLKGEEINEVIIGNVLSAGIGQAPARQAALFGGLPESVECMTINKVCGSGLKAVMLAEQAIKCGDASLILAGGMESMSNAPFLLKGIREGIKFGNQSLYDSMLYDGLIDVYSNLHMGNCSEQVAKEKNITREEQDSFAIESYKRALAAQEKGLFNDEILPISVKDKLVSEDEEPKKVKFEKIPSLKPVFEKDGTITAANASKLNDGAAITLVADEDIIKKYNLKPLVKIISQAAFAMNPQKFALAPIGAIKKSLEKAKLTITDIDLFEINEAFSMVTIAVMKELGIPHEKVNVNGGAVALGHPIGASGARLLTTLIYEMKRRNSRYGLISLCIGGGEAVSLIVENIN